MSVLGLALDMHGALQRFITDYPWEASRFRAHLQTLVPLRTVS